MAQAQSPQQGTGCDKMNIRTLDGRVQFAMWMVGDTPAYTEKERDDLTTKTKLRPTEIEWEKDIIDKVEGVKYASRSEAIRHLQENKMPESETVKRLTERVTKAEQELTELKMVKEKEA